MSKIALSQTCAGDACVVLDIDARQDELRNRLFVLGVIPGSLIRVLRFAPLGDPIQIKVGASLISIRKSEAQMVSVEVQ